MEPQFEPKQVLEASDDFCPFSEANPSPRRALFTREPARGGVYFLDASLASAFVAWCAGFRVRGALQVERENASV